MGFLGFGKSRDDVIDLSGYYKKRPEKTEKEKDAGSKQNEGTDFLSNLAGASSQSSETPSSSSSDFVDLSGTIEDKRKRFAKIYGYD